MNQPGDSNTTGGSVRLSWRASSAAPRMTAASATPCKTRSRSSNNRAPPKAPTSAVVATFIVGFALVHALLFTFGQGVATAALIGSGVVMAAVPVVWGLVIRRHLRGGGG